MSIRAGHRGWWRAGLVVGQATSLTSLLAVLLAMLLAMLLVWGTPLPLQAQDGPAFPATARIQLIGADETLDIGQVEFTASGPDRWSFSVEIDSPAFNDHFLSMRPFRCLEHPEEWFCYLPYPYELADTIALDDLVELEYHLLFIRKTAGEFGIDAWNGLYYRLEMTEPGVLEGKLLQGDLNVLQEPPEPGSHPVDLNEFTDEDSAGRRFPRLLIRQ